MWHSIAIPLVVSTHLAFAAPPTEGPIISADAESAEPARDPAIGGSVDGALDVGSLIDKAGGFELRLWSSAAVGAAPEIMLGVGGMPQLGLSARVAWGFIEPEMVLGYGAYAGFGHSKLRLSVGSKFILNLDVARPFFWAGYSHIHETLFSDIVKDPIGTTLTTADAVGHRSGMEVGVGFLFPFTVPMFGSYVRMEAYTRATAMYLPQLDKLLGWTDEGSPVAHDGYLLLEMGVGFPVIS